MAKSMLKRTNKMQKAAYDMMISIGCSVGAAIVLSKTNSTNKKSAKFASHERRKMD
jgi:hypothetical protein